MFAGSWGQVKKPTPDNPVAFALNTKRKYVVSNSLKEPKWPDTAILSGDVSVAVRELKASPGGELQVHGSGKLVGWLLENELVDEMIVYTYPLILGQGTRLFPETGKDRALELVESRSTPSGVILQTYRVDGKPAYKTATMDSTEATT